MKKSATLNKCNMKKVQHGKNAIRKNATCKSATWKQCNLTKVQHKRSKTRKKCNMKKVKLEKKNTK